jgi:hypothetical protein
MIKGLIKHVLCVVLFSGSALVLQGGLAAAAEAGENRPPYLAGRYLQSPAASFDDLGPGAEVTTEEHQVALGLFRFDTRNSVFDLGLDYEYTHYDYTNVNSRDRDLHRLQIPLLFESRFDAWQLQGFVAPGVSTSSNIFKDFLNRGSSDDVFATARVAFHKGDDGRPWFVGLAYDRSFGEPTLYPVAGVELSPTPAIKLRLAFPDPAFNWQISDRQSLQGRIFPAGHQWRVVSDDFTRSFEYRVEAVRAEINWNLRIWRQLSIDVGLGYDTAREHRFEDDQGLPLVSGVADEWIAAVGFRLGPAVLPYAHGANF